MPAQSLLPSGKADCLRSDTAEMAMYMMINDVVGSSHTGSLSLMWGRLLEQADILLPL